MIQGLAAAYRQAAELSDPELIVWAIGAALMQVEGALSLAVDPLWPGAKGWPSAKARNKDIEACEALSGRLRELIEMLERVRPTVGSGGPCSAANPRRAVPGISGTDGEGSPARA